MRLTQNADYTHLLYNRKEIMKNKLQLKYEKMYFSSWDHIWYTMLSVARTLNNIAELLEVLFTEICMRSFAVE